MLGYSARDRVRRRPLPPKPRACTGSRAVPAKGREPGGSDSHVDAHSLAAGRDSHRSACRQGRASLQTAAVCWKSLACRRITQRSLPASSRGVLPTGVAVSLSIRTPVMLDEGPPPPGQPHLNSSHCNDHFHTRSCAEVLGLSTSTDEFWGT